MRVLAEYLGYAVAAGFVLLTARAVKDLWLRRQRQDAYLVMAIGALAVLALASQLELAYPPVAWLAAYFAVLGLMSSGYALLLFRGTFIPLSRRAKVVAGVAVLAAAIVGEARMPDNLPALQAIGALAPLLVWVLCAGEPTVRFWLAARHRPAVQRSRLRALSFGYGSIVLILALSLTGMAGTESATGLLTVAVMWSIALCALPMLYMALWPPRWLRSRWRRSEELSFREALQGLLLSDTHDEAARAVVEWGMRLVGAGAGALVIDSRTAASTGLSAAHASCLAMELKAQSPLAPRALEMRGDRLYLNLARLPEHGSIVLVLVAGDFTPIFGADEMETLRQFGITATAALERLKLISELTEANSAKRDFLSRMSHELRTPLNSVLGFSQLLATELTDPKHARQVGHIHQAGRHLLAMINDILDLTRIETGQMPMSVEPVAVANAVQQAVDLIVPLADLRAITIDVATDADEHFVLADNGRLAQILINLLSNAVKFSPEGSRVRVTSQSTVGRVRINIVDSGIGIDPADQESVFQPFIRVNAGRSVAEGTGIGLSLSKALAELMKGSLGFSSQIDVGSDFWVELPEAIAHERPPSRLPGPDARLAQLGPRQVATVVYIEDNQANADLMSAIVDRLPGVRLRVAKTGAIGLELARTESPDIIFLDQHLPDFPGLEVLRRLRREPSTLTTPVVMLSADVAIHADHPGFAAAQAFITKPLDVTSVVMAIDRAMRPVPPGRASSPIAAAPGQG